MRPLILIALAIFALPICFSSILISEVHPDPILDESLNEWVEITNDGSQPVDVGGWVFGDDVDNSTIEGPLFEGEGATIPAFGFAILADENTRVYENFNVSEDAIHLYIDDAALGNGLSNDGEMIYLYANGTLIAFANYTRPTSGFSSSLLNGSWQKASPTPGWHANGSTASGCDYELSLVLNSTNFDDPDDFSWKLIARNVRGGATNISARAAIHDMFGNTEQEYSPFTNQSITSQRTSSAFSPNLDEGQSYILSANLTTQCEDTNQNNNKDERIFTIQGVLTTDSTLKILSILDQGTDRAAAFGQTIRVRINAYRGETSKESIAAWIEDGRQNKLTKQSRATVDEKYSNTTLTIPLQIIPNCDEDFDDGEYTLKVEGLDTDDEMDIDVEGITGDLCDGVGGIEVASTKSASRSGKLFFEIKGLPAYENNEESATSVRITNDNDEPIEADLWSYLYKGSVSYSGERESNKQHLSLPAHSTSDVEVANIPQVKEEGEYRVKFLLQPQDKKTPQELAFDTFVKADDTKSQEQSLASTALISAGPLESAEAVAYALKGPQVVFSSSAQEAKSIAPVILIVTLSLLSLALMWRR